MELSMIDLKRAYLAGIIDGEGCIRIYKDPRRLKKAYYGLTLSVGSTRKELMDFIHIYGVGHTHYKKSTQSAHKDSFEWMAVGIDAISIILKVLPYLIIKKPQAMLALTFWKDCPSERVGLVGTDKDIVETREFYYGEMKKLNATGTENSDAVTSNFEITGGEK